jgi:MFS family permease
VVLGLIEGVAQAVVSLLSVIIGVMTDRDGKRVCFVRWGYGLPILGKALIAVAGSWQIVLLGRSIDRIGKGLRSSPRDALIGDACDASLRGRAFGFHRMMDTAGAVIGVVLAGSVLWFYGDSGPIVGVLRTVFGAATIFALCSLLVTFLLEESSLMSFDANGQNREMGTYRYLSWSVGGLGREYWITLGILTIFAFANSSDLFLLLRASDVGFSPLGGVMVYAWYNVTYAALSYTAGKLSDSYGRWRIILLGWVLYAVVYAGVALTATNVLMLWVLFGLYGVYMALTEGVSKALIIDCVPAERKGVALSLLYMVLGVSTLSSNIVAGYLWQRVGSSSPFWVGAGAAMVAVFAAVGSNRLEQKSP